MTEFQIILPKGADLSDALDHGLLTLTEAVCQFTGEESGYGLGGRFGYGEDFENDVFAMRRYYWGDCDCGWSRAEDTWHSEHHGKPDYEAKWQEFLEANPGHKETCSVELPNFRHKRTGFEVRWYKYIGRGMETKNDENIDLQAIFSECVSSLRR